MQLYIRSSDVFLGLPYNTAALALLTMLAQQCDLIPHEIIVTTGDTTPTATTWNRSAPNWRARRRSCRNW
jgi:hypothetical protein